MITVQYPDRKQASVLRTRTYTNKESALRFIERNQAYWFKRFTAIGWRWAEKVRIVR